MNSAAGDVKLTYDDFVRFPDDGLRHELIDGAHYVTASPNTKHQRVLLNLTILIEGWLRLHPIGRMFFAPFDIVLSQFDVVEPDLLYMSNQRAAEILTAQHVRGVPELIVEIGSPATRQRDESIKRQLYERTGVSEYWFVDPQVDLIRVYRRNEHRFASPTALSLDRDDVLTTPLLPGLVLPLREVFRD